MSTFGNIDLDKVPPRTRASNLLQETINILKENKLTSDDVLWVGSYNEWFSWEHFASIADTYYNESFGIEEVAKDLLVVGDDWWLMRQTFDGSEWWEFMCLPQRPSKKSKPTAITRVQHVDQGLGGYYGVICNLKDLNTKYKDK